MQKVDYYKSLGLEKTATQNDIKQSYRKLALKHHPDKNEDKEQAKLIFTQITQAYTVLNDPAKREKYDKYGITEGDLNEMGDFDQFMADFGLFEQFLDDFLSVVFSDMKEMQKMFSKMTGSGNKKKGGSRRKRGGGGGGASANMMNKMYDDMLKEMMKEINLQDLNLDQMGEGEDDFGDLTEDEILLLQFAQEHVTSKKKKGKTRLFCSICEQKVPQDELLIHFGEKHKKEFAEWKLARGQPKQQLTQ